MMHTDNLPIFKLLKSIAMFLILASVACSGSNKIVKTVDSDLDFAISRDLIRLPGDSEFSPDSPFTRAQTVRALAMLVGAGIGYTSSSFTDVADDDPAMPFIEWAVDAGIAIGMGNGRFAPNDPINREQFAFMLKNSADYLGKGPVGAWAIRLYYSDLQDISDWAFEGVMFCFLKGIMTNYQDNNFAPKAYVTTAEAATILRKFFMEIVGGDIENLTDGQDPQLLARSMSISAATIYAEQISGEWADKHERMIILGEGTDSQTYRELLAELRRIADNSPVRNIFIMLFANALGMELTMDTIQGAGVFGTYIENEAVFLDVRQGNPSANEFAWRDENNNIFLPAYAAVYNSEGLFTAILGVNFPTPELNDFPEMVR